MKRVLLLFALFAITGITSCCRYRSISPCWTYEQMPVKKDLEKKDLKKEQR